MSETQLHTFSRVRALLAVALLTAGLCTLQARAATNTGASKPPGKNTKADIHHNPVSTKVDASIVKVHKREPIPHKAFDLQHPQTGKKVAADTMLDLPTGKKIKAGEYYTHLNDLEKKFNAIGHSLRDKAAKTILQETVIDKQDLSKKSQAIKGKHQPFDAKKMRKIRDHKALLAAHQENKKTDTARLAAIKKGRKRAGTTPANATKTWNYTLGSPKTLSVFVDGKVDLQGSESQVSFAGEANAGGYLMNNRIEVLKGTASATMPATGPGNVQLNLYVLGNRIFNLNESVPATWTKTVPLSKTIDKSVTFRYQLGPIPLSVKIGAQGTVGVKFFVGIRPLAISAQVVPNLQVRVYVQAGIDIVIARAGVGGQVVLISEVLTFGADLDVGHDATRGVYIHEHLYAQNQMDLLSGNLNVFAEVTVPKFGIPPWEKKHYQWNIWNWTGFKTTGYLFNIDNKTFLSEPAKTPAPSPAPAKAA